MLLITKVIFSADFDGAESEDGSSASFPLVTISVKTEGHKLRDEESPWLSTSFLTEAVEEEPGMLEL